MGKKKALNGIEDEGVTILRAYVLIFFLIFQL